MLGGRGGALPFWSGYVFPLIGGNSTDGVVFGGAAEIFSRPDREDHGYRLKISASSYQTWGLTYTSQFAQLELRGQTTWIVRGGYQAWTDLPYAGVGGEAVATLRSDPAERGNGLRAPFAMVAAARPIGIGWRAWAQIYAHPAWLTPAEGGLLEALAPFGAEGGVYGDVALGVERDTTDRWPLPARGGRAELDLRGGGTWAGAAFAPLLGVHGEVARWWPLGGDGVVLGLRAVGDQVLGPRPVWEQNVTGGRWRDEIGFEQAFSGYGRVRTRGDGWGAFAVELRPRLFAWTVLGASIDGHLSAFAELGWLFDGPTPGPPMPSVGLGPEILWQRGSQIRPFVSWGWRSDAPGGARRPVPQIGLSVNDPL